MSAAFETMTATREERHLLRPWFVRIGPCPAAGRRRDIELAPMDVRAASVGARSSPWGPRQILGVGPRRTRQSPSTCIDGRNSSIGSEGRAHSREFGPPAGGLPSLRRGSRGRICPHGTPDLRPMAARGARQPIDRPSSPCRTAPWPEATADDGRRRPARAGLGRPRPWPWPGPHVRPPGPRRTPRDAAPERRASAAVRTSLTEKDAAAHRPPPSAALRKRARGGVARGRLDLGGLRRRRGRSAHGQADDHARPGRYLGVFVGIAGCGADGRALLFVGPAHAAVRLGRGALAAGQVPSCA